MLLLLAARRCCCAETISVLKGAYSIHVAMLHDVAARVLLFAAHSTTAVSAPCCLDSSMPRRQRVTTAVKTLIDVHATLRARKLQLLHTRSRKKPMYSSKAVLLSRAVMAPLLPWYDYMLSLY